VDGKLYRSDGVAGTEGPRGDRSGAGQGVVPLLFGVVTLLCLLAAMTLSAYGHRPVLMLPVAIACAIVFVRHGDGRRHSWTPLSVEEGRRAGREGGGDDPPRR